MSLFDFSAGQIEKFLLILIRIAGLVVIPPFFSHFNIPVMVKIGAPVIVSLFLTGAGLGIIARTVPQMNVFIVAFPLKTGAGFLMLAALLKTRLDILTGQFLGIKPQDKGFISRLECEGEAGSLPESEFAGSNDLIKHLALAHFTPLQSETANEAAGSIFPGAAKVGR